MKFYILLLLLVSSTFLSSAQSKFATTKIASWTLEHFPTHYLVKAHHVIKKTSPKTGKLISYQEVNEYGSPDGISVIMQDNLIYPYSVTYWYNGEMVYRASYFSNSDKARDISNRNTEGLFDGPNLIREINANNTIEERKTVYKLGKDISIVEPKKIINFNSEGYLEGYFECTFFDPKLIASQNRTYKGEAVNGIIKFYECYRKDGSYEKAIFNDSLIEYIYVDPSHIVDTSRTPRKIFRILQVTNSEEVKEKNKFSFLLREGARFFPDIVFDDMRESYLFQYDGDR